MKPELLYLALVSALTGVLWLPYVLERLTTIPGLMDAVGYPRNPRVQPEWAQRVKRAHANAVENLVVFAPLVLVANALSIGGPAIAMACTIYFWARLVHAVAYSFAIPWVRTLAFTVGFLCQAVLAWNIVVR